MISERLQQRIANLTGGNMPSMSSNIPKGAISNREMEMFEKASTSNLDPMDNLSEDDKQILSKLLDKQMMQAQAPLGTVAAELAAMGQGEDTQLAHLRTGEVVLPPEAFEDESFDNAVQSKFRELGINPEAAVVGSGIAALNPQTGLEQFGFFKKLGKSLKKVVKKVAPVALPLLIPGVGGALSTGLGSIGSAIGSTVSSVFPGLSGAVGTIGNIGSQILGGAQGIREGIGGLIGMGSQDSQQVVDGSDDKNIVQLLSSKLLPQSVEDALGTGTAGGGLSNLIGGGEGSPLGIGALAATLGKLAYEDAKKQKGVPLTPLTTMSPTGRYNIEAEIARRMGQPAPNPVEFGLLPAGTIPELSGGKPRGMQQGGIMAFARGGAVQMQEGGEMNPNNFPRMDGDINGPGTETSDDIPAMLSDGEFVMTARAVRGAGSYDMQSDPTGIISLVPSLTEDRDRGMNLMYEMMDAFQNQAEASS
tara:strand:+ start:983 stop:2410 length:1428 start_codon:yes stop_codon:yes gene_type:complete